MGFLIGFLTFIMVVDCVVLILLVLVQLPKKEAGAGLAFGGSASDALFGAGSGNVLTRITKYTAGIFFALAIILAVMQRAYHSRNTTAFTEGLSRSGQVQPLPAIPAPPPPQTPASPTNVPKGVGTMTFTPLTNVTAKPSAEQAAPATSTDATPAAPK